MILAIATDGKNSSLALYQAGVLAKEKNWSASFFQSEKLLVKIDQFLKNNKIKLSDLRAMAVYQGPGSYTSLRIAMAIANSLAWGLRIPVVGIKTQNSKLPPAPRLRRTGKTQNYPSRSRSAEADSLKLKTSQIKISALQIAKQAEKIIKRRKVKKFQDIVIPVYQS